MNIVLRAAIGAPLLVIGALALAASAVAQQGTSTPGATAPKAKATKPAAKSKPKSETATAPSAPSAPSIGGVQPTLLGMYGEWGAYTASPGGRKICFALAKPSNSESTPPNRSRDPAYMFVSSRPAEKVKDEVSVLIGYGFKPNTDATLEVAGASFPMYTQSDGAWLKNAAEESRLVDAMRKGSDVTVKGVSARGTTTRDVFSLKGLGQALDKVGAECQ